MSTRHGLIVFIIVIVIITAMGVYLILPDLAFAQTPMKYRGRCGDGICDRVERANPDLCPEDCEFTTNIPYYFVAIHNEPTEDDLEDNYNVLKQIVAKANEYKIKLTLMFTPPWADFIMDNTKRAGELENWKAQGHEIAGHHHAHGHKEWDGYTYLSEEDALRRRAEMGLDYRPYLGNLNDFITALKKLNPNIHSGCMNDEGDKNELPDEIIYDTCSGYANFGKQETRLEDSYPEKGKNEFIAGTVNGIERKWLAHTHIFNDYDVESAKQVYNSMTSGVFGGVAHSVEIDAEAMMKFMDFLHSIYPQGKKKQNCFGNY